ncbi:hypothetical protein GCT19_41045 [Paraburkholderia sp. CNPSo 3155]|uniref:hypothetical protein n=1 Tax=Paraburkholderia atlantica TaxID=2654982 RepID=UPI00128DB474|nr:hypothetical protein [Paraburkholderia atlantica]MPW11692.1 hypothetical protein [Paraburkholderia atlantica]
MALYEIAGYGLKPVVQKTFTDLGMLERAIIQHCLLSNVTKPSMGLLPRLRWHRLTLRPAITLRLRQPAAGRTNVSEPENDDAD